MSLRRAPRRSMRRRSPCTARPSPPGTLSFELREAVAALQGKLQLEDARTVALRGATDRAARASADLLEARRRCCELVGELASANAALQRMQAERWRRIGPKNSLSHHKHNGNVSYSTKPDPSLDRSNRAVSAVLLLVRIMSTEVMPRQNESTAQLRLSPGNAEISCWDSIRSIHTAIDTASLPTAPTATATAGVSLFSANELSAARTTQSYS